MANHHLNRLARNLAVEQSLDAAIELNEMIDAKRDDAPALSKLARLLTGTQPEEGAPSKRELLSSSQLASLSFRAAEAADSQPATARDLDTILDLFFRIANAGLKNFSEADLVFVRDFCLGLNRELVLEVANRTIEPAVVRSTKFEPMALHGN